VSAGREPQSKGTAQTPLITCPHSAKDASFRPRTKTAARKPNTPRRILVNDLVQRLAAGSHPVEVSLRPERTVKLFREMLDRGHVLVKFTQTRGGTELGVPLDKSRSDLTQANFDSETGKVRVCGELTLDYVPVRVVADIDLPSLQGQGHLEILGEERTS